MCRWCILLIGHSWLSNFVAAVNELFYCRFAVDENGVGLAYSVNNGRVKLRKVFHIVNDDAVTSLLSL